MLLYLNGVLQDSTKELEVFNEDKGFTVTVIYKIDSRYAKLLSISSQILNNCTEIHNLYNINWVHHTAKIAFESDIHMTGCTREIEDLEIVWITDALSIEENY
jgi:hypothetical protein